MQTLKTLMLLPFLLLKGSCDIVHDMRRSVDGLFTRGCEDVRVYPIRCNGRPLSNRCVDGVRRTMGSWTFTAIPEQGKVVVEDQTGLRELEQCVVKDCDSWQCTGDLTRGRLVQHMPDGSFTEEVVDNDSSVFQEIFVTRLEWRIRRFGEDGWFALLDD